MLPRLENNSVFLISTKNTVIDLVVTKELRRCKLAVNDEIVEQVMSYRYLGVEISAHQDRRSEVKNQIDKASRIAGCLKDIIWKNQFLKIEAKTGRNRWRDSWMSTSQGTP